MNSDFNRPRDTFEDCMQAIYADVKMALELLPTDYVAITSDAQIPAKYRNQGVSVSQYNRVCGKIFAGRMSGRIAEAVRAQAALLAASPNYQDPGNTTTWKDAADYAAVVLDRINGVSGMDADGWTWYANTDEIKSLSSGECPAEILWRGTISPSYSLEEDNYPPTAYGYGRVNPTQNFVDAFPMANGYPIDVTGSNYNAADPYAGRDPRLEAYVLYNGMKVGATNIEVNTAADATGNDGLNKEDGRSTRTGYYLRKLLRQDINLDPNVNSTQDHYIPRIRYTELFLIYAEAANEAFGPTANGGHAYSAYDVVKALRSRAGVGTDNGDAYLESIKNDQNKMRELIRNERRLELSFEGFRFWDLRRWKADLTEKAYGVSIKGTAPKTYDRIEVDNRIFQNYMYNGPIPYSEMLKFNALEQNQGW